MKCKKDWSMLLIPIMVFSAIFFPLYIGSCTCEHDTHTYDVKVENVTGSVADSSKIVFIDDIINDMKNTEVIKVFLIYPTGEQNARFNLVLGNEIDRDKIPVTITRDEYELFIAANSCNQRRRIRDIAGNVFPGENLMITFNMK